MGSLAILVVVALVASPVDDGGKDRKVLAPADARKKVGETVTVEMTVKASKNRLEKRGEIYLDSEEDFRDEKNLAVVIQKAGAEKFQQAGIDDPAAHFKGKTLRVTGVVTLVEDRPRIVVDDPKQVQVVEKK